MLPSLAVALYSFISLSSAAFVHPGLLHNSTDFDRVATKVAAGEQPWTTAFQKLESNSHASPTWSSRPVATVIRGGSGQNYPQLYGDIAAAYALSLRWKISGNTTYADAAGGIIDAWSSTLTTVTGNSDKFLASGLYGYQFANVVEIMRDYSAWASSGLDAAVSMLVDVFYPMNLDFMTRHNDADVSHYWSNWDLCNMASALAIGVVADNQTIFDDVMDYFYTGAGQGSIDHVVWIVYNDSVANVDSGDAFGQLQESGRDQGHTMLSLGLLAAYARMAESQGVALFDYDDQRILKAAEYAAKYNLGYDVPYTTFSNVDVTQTVISNNSRGDVRPIWDMLNSRYADFGDRVQWTTQYADLVRNSDGTGSDGGGGNYGPNSGGYDQLGYQTLMYTL